MEEPKLKRVDLIFDSTSTKDVLSKAIKMKPEEIIEEILESGLRGRGGAGFPTGLKWKYAAAEKSAVKYIVCNADEGEPGTFKDRQILEEVPKKVFAGMAIAGLATGAKKGYVYLRGEYRYLLPKLLNELDFFQRRL